MQNLSALASSDLPEERFQLCYERPYAYAKKVCGRTFKAVTLLQLHKNKFAKM